MSPSVLHGFWYLEADGEILTFPLTKKAKEYIDTQIVPSLRVLSEEEYVRRFAGLLASAVRQSYYAWMGGCHWCLELDQFTVIVMEKGNLQLAELPSPPDEELSEQYDLIYTPYDALMEGELSEWKSIAPEAKAALSGIIAWTDSVHTRLR